MPPKPIRLRIVLIDPPTGVAFALQQGRAALVAPTSESGDTLLFDFELGVADATATPPRLVGAFAQGPPGARFVYINAGTSAGDPASAWTRRAKVPLTKIDAGLIDELRERPAARLEARIAGKARDGGPACASVPLLAPWRIVDR